MASAKQPKTRRTYSIGEWYGVGFETLSPSRRHEQAKIELATDSLTGTPCPFQKGYCNKKGGVCSLRCYEQVDKGPVTAVGPLITTCPIRFLENETIFRWIGETILHNVTPLVLSEIGFLDRLIPSAPNDTETDNQDFIGRIDNVIVHPSQKPIDWCALELQAVYFSGRAMKKEFDMLSKQKFQTLHFPAANRHPDYRSSGPKRLLPQLQTKVPTIRTWGKKMAVVIDEAFFESLVGLEPERHLSNAEIIWFVIGFDPAPTGWILSQRKAVYTKLDSSVKALTGGVPLSRERFEEQLRSKIGRAYPQHPLALKSD
jgi:hypothetical protein